MTSALLVRQPIRAGETEPVIGAVTDRCRERGDDGPDALLPEAGVATASLFVGRPGGEADELVWYLEAEADAAVWRDPLETVAGSPVLGEGVTERLGEPLGWELLSEGDGTLAVHATLSGRPRTVETAAGPAALVVVGDEAELAVDVVLARVSLRPGLPDRFVRSFVRLMRRLDEIGWVERRIERWVQPVLEQERMYTESIFLARTNAATDLLWYMETADFAAAVQAYEDTPSLVARTSDAVLSWAFERPGVLRQRDPETEYELIAHAVSRQRP